MSEREIPLKWSKSSLSMNGDCVEWAHDSESVYVRDSKRTAQMVLKFTHAEWQAFIAGVKCGEADLNAGGSAA
jgi:Domain of unknown function (DUF397)